MTNVNDHVARLQQEAREKADFERQVAAAKVEAAREKQERGAKNRQLVAWFLEWAIANNVPTGYKGGWRIGTVYRWPMGIKGDGPEPEPVYVNRRTKVHKLALDDVSGVEQEIAKHVVASGVPWPH